MTNEAITSLDEAIRALAAERGWSSIQTTGDSSSKTHFFLHQETTSLVGIKVFPAVLVAPQETTV